MSFTFRAPASRGFKLLVFASVSTVAVLLAGCSSTPKDEQFAASAPVDSPDLQNAVGYWGERYKANPNNAEAAHAYARSLMASGQQAQAVAVLQRTVLANPYDLNLKGALGNALASNGQYDEALNVFQQAHTPDKPNWRVLSAQGAVLDQMGRPQDARKYYQTALRLSPDEPSVLSNLALSYALTGDIGMAQKTMEKAASNPRADARVRQNLSLIVGLQGRFNNSDRIGMQDAAAAQSQQNAQSIRNMLAQQNTWGDAQNGPSAYGNAPFATSAPRGYPYGNPNAPFATSIDQQVYGGYQPAGMGNVPYGYVAPPPQPRENTHDWQDRIRENRDRYDK